MEELGLWLLGGTAVIAAVVFVLWVIAAILGRIFAWVLVFWIASVALGLLVGILIGIVIPPRVLSARLSMTTQIASPDDVVNGLVLGKAPRGASRHFGWDRAWPVYNPYQATRDATAVHGKMRRVVTDAFSWLFGRPLTIVRLIVLLPAFVAFAVGVLVSAIIWTLVMGLIGVAIYLLQEIAVVSNRAFDWLTRKRRRATLRCAKCYRVTTLPSYQCPNSSCTWIHRDVRPGPLGIINRRCGCGTRMPATVGRAAKRLVTVCPYCSEVVPQGSGTRRVLPIPVIGSVGAGKTQFLSSGVVELESRATSMSGSLAPISPIAEQFLATAAAVISSGSNVTKTPWVDYPEGVPFVLRLPKKELELQLMDAAGENFVDWERSQGLGYIDTADVLIFILDPLTLPRVHEQMRLSNTVGIVPIAQGDPEDSYASVVDRLRAEDVKLRSKNLAIVVTKMDVVVGIAGVAPVDPDDGKSIRSWLRDNGADGFVRRIDQDFKKVAYFAVDSFSNRDGRDALHPVKVLDWALTTTDPRLTVLPQLAPAGKETK